MDPTLNQTSFIKQDSIQSEMKKLVLSRLNQLTAQNNLETALKKSNIPVKNRKLIFGAIGSALGGVAGGLGDAVGSVAGGLGGAASSLLGLGGGGGSGGEGEEGEAESESGDGSVGLGIGAAAAGVGMMKKKQREMEHRFALKRVENEMAATQFSADFQDQAIMELSKSVGTANYVDGRVNTIMKTLDYSLSHIIYDFYEILV